MATIYHYGDPDNKASCITMLLTHVSIHPVGAGPSRSSPDHCWLQDRRSYRPLHKTPPSLDALSRHFGGVPRVTVGCREQNTALILDQDVTTQWQFTRAWSAYEVFHWERAFAEALAMETMYCAAEVFVESLLDEQKCSDRDLIPRFQSFLRATGTQTVTITISSLIRDMIDHGMEIEGLRPHLAFTSHNDLEDTLEQFIITRDCWHHTPGHAPAVIATFDAPQTSRRRRGDTSLDWDAYIHFRWNPPTISFNGLRNVVSEADEIILQPSLSAGRPFSTLSRLTVYYGLVGQEGAWLAWCPETCSFRGKLPISHAAEQGTQRMDQYTTSVGVYALLRKSFPGKIQLECTVRCAVPLTIKRRPDYCASIERHEIRSPVRERVGWRPVVDGV